MVAALQTLQKPRHAPESHGGVSAGCLRHGATSRLRGKLPHAEADAFSAVPSAVSGEEPSWDRGQAGRPGCSTLPCMAWDTLQAAAFPKAPRGQPRARGTRGKVAPGRGSRGSASRLEEGRSAQILAPGGIPGINQQRLHTHPLATLLKASSWLKSSGISLKRHGSPYI